MPGPSNAYSACLEPAPGARRAVLASGISLYLAGAAALWSLPGSRSVVIMLLLAWLAHGIYVCGWQRRRQGRIANVVLDATGAVELHLGTGKRTPVRRLPGTIVLEQAIWLRYRHRDGRIGTELFTGDPRRDAEFRRAAVLLRLLSSGQNS